MSNGSKLEESSFRLPEGKDVEVVIVRLDDGRIIARTKEELELLERPEATEGPPASES